MGFPHRCSKCQKRYTFSRIWNEYIINKKCSCGSKSFYIDKHRIRFNKQQRCNCTGYHFPHRNGSRYCDSNVLSAYYIAKDRHGVAGDELLDCFLDCVFNNPIPVNNYLGVGCDTANSARTRGGYKWKAPF